MKRWKKFDFNYMKFLKKAKLQREVKEQWFPGIWRME
jgi:hypothetical protein